MAMLHMRGPYVYNDESIDTNVRYSTPGNYALGIQSESKGLSIQYVGRAEDSLKNELKYRLGKTPCTHFCYCYAFDAEGSFHKQCIDYHNFKPLLNKEHPKPAQGKDWKCPICNKLGKELNN